MWGNWSSELLHSHKAMVDSFMPSSVTNDAILFKRQPRASMINCQTHNTISLLESWIKVKVKKTGLKKFKRQKKEKPAFKLLCQNATEINKHLTDIQTISYKLNLNDYSEDDSDEDSDEDLHEDFDIDKDEEDKKSLIEEIKRLVKVMGDIAVHLKDDEPMALGSHQRRQKALTWSVFR